VVAFDGSFRTSTVFSNRFRLHGDRRALLPKTSGSKDGEDARGHDVALGLPLSSMGLMGKLAYGIVVSRRWLLRAIVLKPSSHAHITTPKTSRWQNVTATILLMFY